MKMREQKIPTGISAIADKLKMCGLYVCGCHAPPRPAPPRVSGDVNSEQAFSLEVTVHVGDAGHHSARTTKFEVRRPSCSEDMTDFSVTALICLVTLTFRLLNGVTDHLCHGFLPGNYQLPVPFRSRLRDRHGTRTDGLTDRQRPSLF